MRQKKESPAGKQGQSEVQVKDKDFKAQMQIVYQSFFERPKTMLDVSLETGILRANICWYAKEWRKTGKIKEIYKGLDKNTKCMASYLSTDKRLFISIDSQLSLFEDGRI